MKLLVVIVATAIAALSTAGCGGANEPQGPVDVTFATQPDPPRMGENSFDVRVTAGGQPVTDADVAVEFFMPAMPEMNMAEMRNTVPLTHAGDGRYQGTGNVMMSGNWDATVTVTRDGQVAGTKKFPITAK
jgi:hypothetical protein